MRTLKKELTPFKAAKIQTKAELNQFLGLTSNLEPSEEMRRRWAKHLELNIPSFDFHDADYTFKRPQTERRQTVPEYSQQCYEEMRNKEKIVG